MKTGKRLASVLVAGMIFCMGGSAFGGRGNLNGNQNSTGVRTLSEAEAATLQFMREEEKLARDVYLAMYDKWRSSIFQNIADSEQRHMDAIKTLLDKYEIKDPASSELGVFNDPDLQTLYGELIDRGLLSELDAFLVGALIEEVDIEDLDIAIDETDKTDLETVYDNLRNGSVNHLKAFVAHIEALGIPYVAQHLSQEEVDALLAE